MTLKQARNSHSCEFSLQKNPSFFFGGEACSCGENKRTQLKEEPGRVVFCFLCGEKKRKNWKSYLEKINDSLDRVLVERDRLGSLSSVE